MITLRTLLLISPIMLAPAASRAPAAVFDEELCPTTCQADADQADAGTVPPGVFFMIQVTGILDGEGDTYCETCNGNDCQATVSFSFDDPSGVSCLNYSWGSGLTSGSGTITETQTLNSSCDDFEPASFGASITSCTPGGGTSFSVSVKLYCPCD